MKQLFFSSLVLAGAAFPYGEAFQISGQHRMLYQRQRCVCFSSDAKEATWLVVNLEKPLGIMLEELEEGAAKGVTVTGLQEDGSAFNSDVKDQLVGLKLISVMGENVSNLIFDDVMSALIDAPSPVTLELMPIDAAEIAAATERFQIGSLVAITVLDGDEETVIEAKVGDNLRAALLENKIEVYKGLKQKLGNW